MIFLKSKPEIEILKQCGLILSKLHGLLHKSIAPGISTKALDNLAEEFIRDNFAKPSFKGYNGFPYSICTSVNDCIVHGVPSNYVLREGDVLSIDCGVYYKGFHTDCAFTHYIGDRSKEIATFLDVAKQSLFAGINKIKPNNTVGDIGHEIFSYIKQHNYFIAEDLVGHGIGKNLHEDPMVPNLGKKNKGPKLINGIVLAIEPMVNLGTSKIRTNKDGSIVTHDGKISAHFEHTVALFDGEVVVLTTFDYI